MSGVLILPLEIMKIGEVDLLHISGKSAIFVKGNDQVNMVVHQAVMIDFDAIFFLQLQEQIIIKTKILA